MARIDHPTALINILKDDITGCITAAFLNLIPLWQKVKRSVSKRSVALQCYMSLTQGMTHLLAISHFGFTILTFSYLSVHNPTSRWVKFFLHISIFHILFFVQHLSNIHCDIEIILNFLFGSLSEFANLNSILKVFLIIL